VERADQLIRRIVVSKLSRSSPSQPADIEDVCSNAFVALLSSLNQNQSIDNFDAYVSVIAYRACSEYFRSRYPQFHRLRNRLRYLLQTSPKLTLWQDPDGEWVCALRGSNAETTLPLDRELILAHPIRQVSPAEAVERALAQAESPIAFDALARAMAQYWNVQDSTDSVNLTVEDPAPLAEAVLSGSQQIQAVWREIIDLPPKQRTALLLNFRDENGSCATSIFIAAGVAGLPQIAAALDMPLEVFVELWRTMPLNDMDIAERLGISRQQVINLRKCAKERLSRRLR
jgi:RNA polymerase sigma factor (sigma-70 family)